jgi:hypothetical protein
MVRKLGRRHKQQTTINISDLKLCITYKPESKDEPLQATHFTATPSPLTESKDDKYPQPRTMHFANTPQPLSDDKEDEPDREEEEFAP